jgi:hypothetical protein
MENGKRGRGEWEGNGVMEMSYVNLC